MKDSLHDTLNRGHFMDDIGEENLFPAKTRPMSVIYAKLDNEICRNCPVRAFPVCQTHLPSGEARSS
jgi:SulP family sulfate permease